MRFRSTKAKLYADPKSSSTCRWICAIGVTVFALFLWPSKPSTKDEYKDADGYRNLTQLDDRLFPYNKEYSTHWPPTPEEIESLSLKTLTFVIYAKVTGELGTEPLDQVDPCNLPRLYEWVKTPQGRLYFEFSEKVGSRGAWLIGQGESPHFYKMLLYSALNSMGWSECHMGNLVLTEKVNPLIYTGSDLARDLFELYVRLVVHFEYVCHVILIGQLKEDVSFDPGMRVVRQIDAIEHWFARRWTTVSLDVYRKYHAGVKPYVGYEPMLESFPKADVLILPYAHINAENNFTRSEGQ